MAQVYKYMVSTRCFTYNQALYIEDTLRGFAMQKTSFPFVSMVVDDASTDGEKDIILGWARNNLLLEEDGVSYNKKMDYGQLIYARHKNNSNAFFAILLLKENHYNRRPKIPYLTEWRDYAKYSAICEGDDYWTDPLKLQKQVDFMESHPDYSMCFHAVEIKAEEGREWHDYFGVIEDREYTSEDTIRRWIIPTCSTLIRAEINGKIPTNPHFVYGDDVIYSTCLMNGKIYGMSAKMGVYRLVPTGWMASNTGTKRLYSSISQRKGLMEEFPFYRCDINYNYMESVYYQLMYTLLKQGNIKEQIQVLKDYRHTLPTSSTFRFVVYSVKSFLHPLKQMIVRNNKK